MDEAVVGVADHARRSGGRLCGGTEDATERAPEVEATDTAGDGCACRASLARAVAAAAPPPDVSTMASVRESRTWEPEGAELEWPATDAMRPNPCGAFVLPPLWLAPSIGEGDGDAVRVLEVAYDEVA